MRERQAGIRGAVAGAPGIFGDKKPATSFIEEIKRGSRCFDASQKSRPASVRKKASRIPDSNRGPIHYE